MASLKSYLPQAGSTVWRSERRLTRSSSSGDEEGLSRTRIKHIVIREVWKREVPSPHALYKIDVMTQSNHWFILRRYQEFHSLHQNLVKQYNIPSDMLPGKTLFSKMSLAHLEKRRNALEHYLQRLINSHHNIAESQELFQFLNVQTHDVLCVTRQLAKVLDKEGRNILASGGVFTFSPTQMYCITRQLQLPHVAIEQSDASNPGEEVVDLGYLYSFIQELRSLCVSGVASRSSPCQELISNQAFDISLFKSLQKLQIEKCHIAVIDGLFRIQKQLTHVTLRNCLKSLKEFLVDCARQKRAIAQATSNVESWRNMSTTKLTDNRVVVRPWFLLTHINMSHNKISTLDHSLKLLPALEQLDLSHNEFVHLNLEHLTSSTLTFLNMSHNHIHYVSATSRDLRNLKSLLLANNKLQNLDGVDCLRGLVELDVRYNDVKEIGELAKISSLLHLRILALIGNPCVAPKSHRIQVFCQLKARELILDGIKITEGEKAKVHLVQGRKAVVASTEVVQGGAVLGTDHEVVQRRTAAGTDHKVIQRRAVASADLKVLQGRRVASADLEVLQGRRVAPATANSQLEEGRGISSAEVEPRSFRPVTSAIGQTQSTQDIRKKGVPYRDDDQDSGFGGNYTGSIDEGGLVFDWSCYSNCINITNSSPYHVSGPSTSRKERTLLKSPGSGVKSSSGNIDTRNVTVVSECGFSSDEEVFPDGHLSNTQPPNQSDLGVNPRKRDLISKSLDAKQTTRTPKGDDHHGKQLAGKRYSKINTKASSLTSSSVPTTLLQLSLNKTASGTDKNERQLRDPDHSDSPSAIDNASLDQQHLQKDFINKETSSTTDIS